MATKANKFKYLNVIMHGAYGYVWNRKEKALHALTPAVIRHVYSARNYGATFPAATSSAHSVTLFGDYRLTGVNGSRNFKISSSVPCLPAKNSGISRCDHYGKRMFRIDLPFPSGDGLPKSDAYYLLESFNVGSIYQGSAAAPLNAIGMNFPSLICFAYQVNSTEELALVPSASQPSIRSGQPAPAKIPLDFLLPRGDYANLHIMGGLDPAKEDMKMEDHAPHARRAFAALVDMFDELPLTLEIPDGFAPQKLSYKLPSGVTAGDIEKNLSRPTLLYGHANCHSATFVIDNG
jgi:hypothetical protein